MDVGAIDDAVEMTEAEEAAEITEVVMLDDVPIFDEATDDDAMELDGRADEATAT